MDVYGHAGDRVDTGDGIRTGVLHRPGVGREQGEQPGGQHRPGVVEEGGDDALVAKVHAALANPPTTVEEVGFYGVGGFIFPRVSQMIVAYTGTPKMAYILAAALLMTGAVLALVTRAPETETERPAIGVPVPVPVPGKN